MSDQRDLDAVKRACAEVIATGQQGTAYLIAEDVAVTCAHVVGGVPAGGRVTLRFHDPDTDTPEVEATVERIAQRWREQPWQDLAILRLASKRTVRPLEPGLFARRNRAFVTFGFPSFSKKLPRTLEGKVQDDNAYDRLPQGAKQGRGRFLVVRSDQLTGWLPDEGLGGLSGAPVVVGRRVVGHLFRTDPRGTAVLTQVQAVRMVEVLDVFLTASPWPARVWFWFRMWSRVMAAAALGLALAGAAAWAVHRWEEARHEAVRRDTGRVIDDAISGARRVEDIQSAVENEDHGAVAEVLSARLAGAELGKHPEVQGAVTGALASLCRVEPDRACPALLSIVELPAAGARARRFPRDLHDQVLQLLAGDECRQCPDLGTRICRYLHALNQTTLGKVVTGPVGATGDENELAQNILTAARSAPCP